MVLVAFIIVIIIWSTTPLSIQWSSQDVGFLFAVTARMTIGALGCLALLALQKRRLPMHKAAIKTYVAASLGVYVAMLSVYWGAQFIPSGLVSVLFGLTPIVTAVMAAYWLGEDSLGMGKLLGAILGVFGISIIFQADMVLQNQAYLGVAGVLFAVLIHCASAIWVKRIGNRMPALELTTGSLLFSAPMYLLTWYLVDGHWPPVISLKSGMAIMYLGIMGSVVGFTFYFYVLKHYPANRVALLTFVTPVLALLIGHTLNHEQIPMEVVYGASFIMSALLLHQFGDRLLNKGVKWVRGVAD